MANTKAKFTTVDDKEFKFNEKPYPKVYKVDAGSNENNITIHNAYDKADILFSGKRSELEIDGKTPENILEVFKLLTPLLFNKGGGNGVGVADIKLEGTNLKITLADNTVLTTDLSPIIVTNVDVESLNWNASSNVLTLKETDGETFTINLSEFQITTTVLENGDIQIKQEGQVKSTIPLSNYQKKLKTETASTVPTGDLSAYNVGDQFLITADGEEPSPTNPIIKRYIFNGISFQPFGEGSFIPLDLTSLSESYKDYFQNWLNDGVATGSSFEVKGMLPAYIISGQANQEKTLVGLNLNQLINGNVVFAFFNSSGTQVTGITVTNFQQGTFPKLIVSDNGALPTGNYTVKIKQNGVANNKDIPIQLINATDLTSSLPTTADWTLINNNGTGTGFINAVNNTLTLNRKGTVIGYGRSALCNLNLTANNSFFLEFKVRYYGGINSGVNASLFSGFGITNETTITTNPSDVLLGLTENYFFLNPTYRRNLDPIGVSVSPVFPNNPAIDPQAEKNLIVTITKTIDNYLLMIKDVEANILHYSEVTNLNLSGVLNFKASTSYAAPTSFGDPLIGITINKFKKW